MNWGIGANWVIGQVGDAWEAKGRYHLGVLGRCERGKWNVYMDREERIVSRASHG
jgi:hypothetical protein